MKEFMESFPHQSSLPIYTRPYFNHSVELKKVFTPEERLAMLEKVGMNVFFFPAEMITGCDFLSDSGTTTMTNEQWAALHMGDESYGSNRGYFQLIKEIRGLFGEQFFNDPDLGKPNAFIFHQGRACEDALFGFLGRTDSGLVIPSNGHFDTTEGNIQINKMEALNLFSKDLKEGNDSCRFKGDIDVDRLKQVIVERNGKIPLVFLTITNNTGGGQPVSMKNIKEVSKLVRENDIPLFFDACRFAENAWFIKNYEEGYADKDVKEIVKEMFSYVDGFTISFKKDGLVNMGGGLFVRDDGLFMKHFPQLTKELTDYQIVKEGHPTYGGLCGRDLMALCVGLKTIVKEEYLDHRIRQVKKFGESMHKAGVPVMMPIGGHAVYVDMNKFFEGTNMQPGDFGGISFTALLLGLYGHRACELGYYAFGSYDPVTKEDKFPEVNFVRFAVPRLRYEKKDLDAVAEAVKALYEKRHLIPGVEVLCGKDLTLRHFKSRFKFKEKA
jgi:tryptophanase